MKNDGIISGARLVENLRNRSHRLIKLAKDWREAFGKFM